MALSPIPFYVFGVLEPTLQIIGFTVASFGPHLIALTQTPTPISHNLLPSEKIITYQFGNLLLLIAILSLSFITTANDAAVASTYLSALWWGDLGHIGVTAWCMGERLLNVGEWTLVNWASLVFPVFLFIIRTLYFAGAF
jgi:drug/metabolite transporter (DMT)-like permease